MIAALLLAAATTAEAGSVVVGARVGTHQLFFDADSAGLGGNTFAVDAGIHVRARYVVYGFLEAGVYDDRTDRIGAGPFATSKAFGAGFRGHVNPEGPWDFLVDLSAGYRFLRVPFDVGHGFAVDSFAGFEPLRVRVGPAVHVAHRLAIEVLLGGAVGRLHGGAHRETCAIAAACADSLLSDEDTQSATYFSFDLAVGLHTWL